MDTINVYLNSYGGEIGEALAICNELYRHRAKIRTIDTGFACSACADIFMAGDERIMYNASALMIHNGWTSAQGNAEQLRKVADDIEKLTQIASRLYEGKVNISNEKLQELLDAETWLTPQEALEMGFATSVVGEPVTSKVSQSVRKSLFEMLGKARQTATGEKPIPESTPNPEPDPAPPENKTLKFISALMR